VGDDGQLRVEALDVLGLLLQVALGDEQREVGVLVAQVLEHLVQDALHVLPDGIAIGTDDHAALHVRVVGELRLLDQVHIPLGKALLARCQLLGHLLETLRK
jgi:hypothetical protein